MNILWFSLLYQFATLSESYQNICLGLNTLWEPSPLVPVNILHLHVYNIPSIAWFSLEGHFLQQPNPYSNSMQLGWNLGTEITSNPNHGQ